ncbi:MAG: hypothetical protein A2249_01645 [Candidatus Jacksonbacteria bacterium RIFOXYA2_FULL_44_7]|uniref:Helix-turn-helix domain-containing protein n=1 Tax=Candidatus Jacksonbacteria bacterium RIFCSPLOWO2_02_FULL_44_20 TaxID=1798460 RepID=A0A1G2A9N7_9BACT|nr:MAG: MamR-like protein [Parcubacteria group bacterium GW2011_GWC2_44_17]KKT50056.1 MAG: MamR-like protein [Parcubacteria group bacterium GW2011_GWF2_44_17]OGY69483.1 MAG: hypothetical protein A3C00_00275 [Candidatus Jacksonbacteria bacterium RIFCSPHIGHO2_02_FULL_44_25]OGY70322.1 MAG: hypothetical protein A3E05_01570 [Candidatus Jacksonbacteria bacterium RIFCSPHIGHO2_12_FULL_44_12]OGY72767.1 MAG: hypothetical protein A3H61_02335 [Candidatus Jacksonbacteria bacterium RIFCSPLOWO2_02_FULL_44_20]
MSHQLDPNTIYTPRETAQILKISQSTIKRLLKQGLIRANKVGGQYRIIGHEILRLISPDVDQKATNVYQKIKRKTIQMLK